MSNDRDNIAVSRRGSRTFAILAGAVAAALVAAGVAYSTGHWSAEATKTGNDGAGLHIPAPAGSTQPPASNAISR